MTPTLRIGDRAYPVLLPQLRDPRLQLAAVIVSLQVLGQTAFGFRLSIAQILVAVLTCAILEVAITFRRQQVIMWPASALLTGNGVAFVLRVPGTEHGDWWSLRGAWIFAAAAGVGLLSKYVIRVRGGHVFNPSNIGLVLCFLVLGSDRAEPLDFWWSPMSAWLALAVAIIVAGGLTILGRLRLLEIAVGFWLAFATGLGVLAATGHEMSARWHVGPVGGDYFWWILVTSPEVLVFLFFMITDPKTIPAGRAGRRAYAVAVGVLATLLIAPQRTEFGAKVALLGALALVCAARPLLAHPAARRLGERLRAPFARREAAAAGSLAGVAAVVGLLVLAGLPARPGFAAEPLAATGATLPAVTVAPSGRVATPIDQATARRIAGTLVAALPGYRLERVRLSVEPGEGQGPPTVVAAVSGARRATPTPFARTLELAFDDGRFAIVRARGASPREPLVTARVAAAAAAGFAGLRLTDVAREVGLDFRHSAFRFRTAPDPVAMMGGGLCWLDYDDDGWLDLFVVDSYSAADLAAWRRRGGLPRTVLYRNVRGRFTDVSAAAGADLAVRGMGCVAADLDGDGHTDLFVTTGVDDKLLWNNGDGTFTEGARASGVVSFGWHAGAAVADVNGDRLPDLFVAGYTDPNAPIAGSVAGFPTNHLGVRDLLFLNEGTGPNGRARFREVGVQAGLESSRFERGLGAVFTDVDGDRRPDLYVANDEDPNRLYLNRPDPQDLGFRLVESAQRQGVADANAGMGVAAAAAFGDGRPDLFVTNNRGQQHAAFRSRGAVGGRLYADGRPGFESALGTAHAGWGVSWADLDRDGNLDLVLANGEIPITDLAADAGPIQVLENLTGQGLPGRFADASRLVGLGDSPRVNGRGVAVADYDNDGDLDVAVNSIGGRLVLLRTTGSSGHWLQVSLAGFHPGALVTAVLPAGRRLVREVQAGGSYLSSEDPRVFFGLGKATRVSKLIVRYPHGRVTELTDVAAGRIVRLGPG